MILLNDKKLAELKDVQWSVNHNLQYVSDSEHYGVSERWGIPKDSKGDCEDYCLLKRQTLRDLDWPKEDLNIAICIVDGQRHAVLVVNTDKGDYVLDNRYNDIQHWEDLPYKWLEVTDKGSLIRWVKIK